MSLGNDYYGNPIGTESQTIMTFELYVIKNCKNSDFWFVPPSFEMNYLIGAQAVTQTLIEPQPEV